MVKGSLERAGFSMYNVPLMLQPEDVMTHIRFIGSAIAVASCQLGSLQVR